MDKLKNLILSINIKWYVGLKQDGSNIVEVIPYIENKEDKKIKVLSDNKIYDVKNNIIWNVIKENYNLKMLDEIWYNDFKHYLTFLGKYEVLTYSKIIKVKNKIEKIYTKYIKDLTSKKQNEKEKIR